MNRFFIKRTFIIGIWVLSIFSSIGSKSQEIKDLVFAHPDNTGLLNMGLFPISNDLKYLLGMTSLYLLDEENLFIDTLVFAKAEHWKYYPINVIMQDNENIAITTPSAFWVVGVKKNQLVLKKNVVVDKSLKKATTNGYQYIPVTNSLMIVIEQKTQNYKLYKEQNNNSYDFVKQIAEHRKQITNFKQGETLSFNNIQVHHKQLFIYDRSTNVIDVYNLEKYSSSYIELPQLKSEHECNLFYIDYFTGKKYVQNYTGSDTNILFELDIATGNLTKVLETPFLIRGVYNNKYYVSGIFDGTYGHYLIPLQGENEDVILLEDEN